MNTVNLSTTGIAESLTVNTFYRNGGNYIFRIESLDKGTVVLQIFDAYGPTGSFRTMSITLFTELFVRKNYTKIKFFKSIKTGLWMERRDYISNRMLSAERYLVKQY